MSAPKADPVIATAATSPSAKFFIMMSPQPEILPELKRLEPAALWRKSDTRNKTASLTITVQAVGRRLVLMHSRDAAWLMEGLNLVVGEINLPGFGEPV
ncbi:MAG: hypothetical protein V4517_14595 [Pseudomonadota bacterium]